MKTTALFFATATLLVISAIVAVPKASAQVTVTTASSEASGSGTRFTLNCGPRYDSGSPPLIVIDGLRVQDNSSLRRINPDDIVSIEILRGDAALDLYGAAANAGVVIITTRQGLVVQEQTSAGLATLGVYPNPAVDHATISFALAEPGEVHVELFDVMGRRVLQTTAQHYDVDGRHDVTLETSRLAAGSYLYRVTAGSEVATGRLTIVR